MKLHANAVTCPKSRALIAERVLERGWTLQRAAEAAGCSVQTARKWVRRAAAGEGLGDRSSAPRRVPGRLPRRLVEAIAALRRLYMTAAQIAQTLGLALSTVSLWLRRLGLGKRSRLEPPEPPNRYERRRPGELVHLDIKQLGRVSARGAGHRIVAHRRGQSRGTVGGKQRRLTGWEFVHVAVDDHSRLAYVEALADQQADTAAGFLRRAVAWFAERGITIERLLSDNGGCYRSRAHAQACRQLGLKHSFTRPYRPRTNGKAERFIRTLTDEWAYGRIYGNNQQRRQALPAWLNHYNYHRPHGSLGHQPPATRINNLVRNYN